MAFREIDGDLWEVIRKYLPPTKPHIGRPRRDPRGLINGILYVLTTGCTWRDVPEKYGTKSTVHRYHLELCEKGVYQAIFLDLLQSGYEIRKVDLTHCSTDTKDIAAKKGDQPAMMAIRR
ncbi:transposase [Methanoculleus taiwanensis]|uniref:Transposase n=1 Tax=Methanoculleus taiwanensis TaxID=1550565 RepID=A0A498H743_9EURY|nr:transposase [Methanoculleus taiwanensis]RXE57374.1 transposase [Methanoculleus taiwanensis]